MTPSLEEWPTKAKEAPFLHEVRLAPPDSNPQYFNVLKIKQIMHLYQSLEDIQIQLDDCKYVRVLC